MKNIGIMLFGWLPLEAIIQTIPEEEEEAADARLREGKLCNSNFEMSIPQIIDYLHVSTKITNKQRQGIPIQMLFAHISVQLAMQNNGICETQKINSFWAERHFVPDLIQFALVFF
ncbi:hypothetical protein ACJX0J_017433, partial [Zea mays]